MAMSNALSETSARALALLKPAKDAYRSLSETVSNLMANAAKKGKNLFEMIKTPDLGLIKERMDALKEKVVEIANDFTDKCSEIYTKAYERVEVALQHYAESITRNIIAIPSFAFQFAAWSFRRLPHKRQQQLASFFEGAGNWSPRLQHVPGC